MLLLAIEREGLLYEEDNSDHRNNTDHRRIIMVAVWFMIRKGLRGAMIWNSSLF